HGPTNASASFVLRMCRCDLPCAAGRSLAPVAAAATVVCRTQDGQGVFDVGLHQLPVRLLDGCALAHERAELPVVVGRAGDGLGEDRGIRGHTTNAPFDPLLQLAAREPAPFEVVEPRALAVYVV